jgi:signal transduction histidine kinase
MPRVSRTDVAVPAALFTWAIVETILRDGPGTAWQRGLIAFFAILPLMWRRPAPLFALAATLIVLLPWGLAAPRAEEAAWPFAALLLLDFSVALYVARAELAVFGFVLPYGTLLAMMGSGYYTSSDQGAGEFLVGAFFCIGAWSAGRLLRRRVLQVEEERAAGGERARDAVSGERARVARELHDVVGHSVGIIAMQAGAAEALVEKDPEAARAHMATVRHTAQDTMREMRRLVQVLREDGVEFEPQPTLAQVEQLVDDARLAGVPARLEVEGERRDLPPAIDLAAYRVVLEGLTNVRKHAGAVDTTVLLRYAPGVVHVEVRNAAGRTASNGDAQSHPGLGLVGLRERVRIFGGDVDASPRDGGFALSARLPLEESRP